MVVDCLGWVCGFPVCGCELRWSPFNGCSNGNLHANLYNNDYGRADRDVYTNFHPAQYSNWDFHIYFNTNVYTHLHTNKHAVINANPFASGDYRKCGL